jgi:hypothetical protein
MDALAAEAIGREASACVAVGFLKNSKRVEIERFQLTSLVY